MSASNYYFNSQPHHPAANASSSHHTGRGRRAPRLSQHPHGKQFRSVRKEEEVVAITKFRQHFEEGRSFDLQDDLDFCPCFVSDDDYPSTSGSDQSSISSGGSPQASPQSHQVTPEPFSLNANPSPYVPTYHSQPTTLKLHQPAATRTRNAIPIVNPSTGVRMASPPSSVSPARMQHQSRRW